MEKQFKKLCENIKLTLDQRKDALVGETYDKFIRFTKRCLNRPKFLWVIYAIIILLLPIIGSVVTILSQKYF